MSYSHLTQKQKRYKLNAIGEQTLFKRVSFFMAQTIDIKPVNKITIDYRPNNKLAYQPTQIYTETRTVEAGQVMGLLLALTYPVAGTFSNTQRL